MTKLSSESHQQRPRLLEELSHRPVTTVQARQELDIFHPAARIQRLRDQGHNIITHRRTVETAKGKHSKVAEYVLLQGGSQ